MACSKGLYIKIKQKVKKKVQEVKENKWNERNEKNLRPYGFLGYEWAEQKLSSVKKTLKQYYKNFLELPYKELYLNIYIL